jgi:hypothetical protein
MAFKTNARRAPARKAPARKATPNRTTEPNTGQTKGNLFADAIDKNGNGRIDPEDLLIGARDLFRWLISWRGAMVSFGAFTLMSAWFNVEAWQGVFKTLGSASIGVAIVVWFALQANELLPILDDLSLGSSIAALVRLQRKPVEVPVVNSTLQPGARSQLRRYQNRERKAEMLFEFSRYFCYGIEIFTLIFANGIFSPIGVEWAGVIKAAIGIVGVEIGVRQTNACGEKLLTTEEREYLREIERAVKRSTVTVEPDKQVA